MRSPLARGARIETLKMDDGDARRLSPLARGARIETTHSNIAINDGWVAPRKGGAD